MYGLIKEGASPAHKLRQFGKSQDLIDLSTEKSEDISGEICPIHFPYAGVKKIPSTWGLYQLDNLKQFFAGYYPLITSEKLWATTLSAEELLCLSNLGNPTGYQCVHIQKLPRSFEKLLNCNISPFIIYGINSSNMDLAKDIIGIVKAYPRPVIFGVSSPSLTLGLPMITEKCYLPVEKMMGAPMREYGTEKFRELVRSEYSKFLSFA